MNRLNQNLLELQRIDIRIEAVEGFLDSLPEKKSELASERSEAEQKVENKRSELEEAKKELRGKERQLKDGEERLKQIQAKLNQVKTNKEYEAALKEMEDQKQANGDLEEGILRLYDRVEEAEARGVELEAEWNEQVEDFDRREKELEKKTASAQAELEDQRGKRSGMVESISPVSLEHYEKVRKHSGRGVARAESEVCQGCHCHIPPQVYNEVLKGDRMITCNNCSRILIHTNEEIDVELKEI
jgi:predicted  nucleic acid-binding Zn-ribbon protein